MSIKKIIYFLIAFSFAGKICFSSEINLRNTVDGKLFLDSLFNKENNISLLADEIEVLSLDISSFQIEPLTLNAYLSYFSSLDNKYSIHSVAERLTFYSLPVFLETKAVLLKYLAIEDLLNSRISSAKQKMEATLFICQLKRKDLEAATMATALSKLAFLQQQKEAAFLNNSLAINAYEHIKLEPELINSLFWQTNLFYEDNRFKEAEEMLLKRVLMKSFRLRDQNSEMQAYYQLGKNYLAMRKKTEALWFFLQARELAKKLKYKEDELKCLLMISKLKVNEGNFSLALSDLKEAEKIIVGDPSLIIYNIDLSKQLSDLYRILGVTAQKQTYSLRFSQLKQDFLNN